MSAKKVPVGSSGSGRSKRPAPNASRPHDQGGHCATKAALAESIDQISMQDLDRLKARSRELMGLIIAAQHRS